MTEVKRTTRSYFAIRLADDPECFIANDGEDFGDLEDCDQFQDALRALVAFDELDGEDPGERLEIVTIEETRAISSVVDLRELRRKQEEERSRNLEWLGQSRLFPREGAARLFPPGSRRKVPGSVARE